MAVNESYANGADGLGDTNELIVDGSAADTGAVIITEIWFDAAAEVYRDIDTAQDGSWSSTVMIASKGSAFHSQKNAFLASQAEYVRLRLKNTSGNTADGGMVGYEVDN